MVGKKKERERQVIERMVKGKENKNIVNGVVPCMLFPPLSVSSSCPDRSVPSIIALVDSPLL